MTLRYSANLGFLWRDLALPERIARAGAEGFEAVEFHEPYDHSPEEIRSALEAANVGLVVGLNAPMGETAGIAALPDRHDEAREQIDKALDYAAALGCPAVHVLSGKTRDSDEAGDAYREAMSFAVDRAAPHGITILIEPICVQAMPGYWMNTLERAVEVVEDVSADNIKILFDVFHVQRAGGDVLTRFKEHFEHIGHVQIASVPDRAEPDRGEIDFAWLLPAMVEAGYDGWFGAEYLPAESVERGLGWRKRLSA